MRRIAKLIVFLVILWFLSRQVPVLGNLIEAPIAMAEGAAASVELYQLQKCILHRKAMNGMYPAESDFDALVAKSFDSKLKDPRLDSWGRPYHYRRLPDGFELRSNGPDGLPGGEDDLVLTWKER